MTHSSRHILKTNFLIFTAALMLTLFATGCSTNESADMVLINGKIITVDKSMPEAEAIAIKADTILAVGSKSEIENYISEETQIIDLKGNVAYPGFIDSHAHFLSLGKAKTRLELRDANNWNEILYEVARAVQKAKPGEWIFGRGWHQEKWNPKPDPNIEGYPLNDGLSEMSPYNPVVLTHASGHAIIANAKAMALAGIDTSTADPEGGRIVRDSLGNAIGVFEENAEGLIMSVYEKLMSNRSPEEVKEEIKSYAKFAEEECVSKGLTTFHDAAMPFDTIDIFKEIADEGKLGMRLNVMIYESNKNLRERIKDYMIIGYGENHLTVRAIKQFMDGALGSRGAWFMEPYGDLEGHTGLNTVPLRDFKEVTEIAIENGFQVMTHAIGDKANREVLNYYERAFKKHPDKTDLRWRVEHAQHLSRNDIPRFAELGVIASMQGCHCTSDAVFVPIRLGYERAEEGAYVWRKLINSGALICNGTDAPVEDVDPIKNFYSSVTRRLPDGTEFYPGQKMTRMEALESYTINGAYAAFQENLIGSLKPGKLADITVLSNDLLTCPDEEILNTQVIYTIVGGKILYGE